MNVFFVSMGCAKNTVDSERLMGRLVALGHSIVDEPDGADVGIINTCGFIQDAVKENIDAILDLERMKQDGTIKRIVVAGCLVNRYEAELRKELPSVDLFARAEEWDSVADFISSLERGKNGKQTSGELVCGRFMSSFGTPWSRFLKVGEGCDTFCSYCSIPFIRGRLRSVPVEELVKEAVALCESGAKELCLVGQDLTAYGRDLYGEPALKRLIAELDREIPDKTWLRLLYLHPDRLTEDVADFLMGTDKVLPYLDVPIQHIDDDILKRMNRRPASAHIRTIFKHIRNADPLFTLRTTIMTGVPGETEEQFQKVLDFLEEAELDRVGVFAYSPEEGTPAASFPDAVPHEIAEERRARIMERQSDISQKRGELFIGRKLDVMIEEYGFTETDEGYGPMFGRSYRDAPEVDGVVCVEGLNEYEVSPGDIVSVNITGCEEHDLFGNISETEEN